MSSPLYKIFCCSYLNPLSDTRCEWIRVGAIVFKRTAKGYRIHAHGPQKDILNQYIRKRSVEIISKPNLTLCPGFFDTHFHWVQDEVRLMPKENLLDWLQDYTWPYEAKFIDKKCSQKKAKDFAKELLQVGTLGGAVYASIHTHSVDHALKYFVGDYVVGNVLMTMNSPEYLIQSEREALKSIEKLSSKYGEPYAMTPPFAPTTSPEVMSAGSKVLANSESYIQTHLSETPAEIEYVLSIYREFKGFEKIKSYTDIYKKCGLLGKKTIMGHGIYLSPKELRMLGESSTKIAHCPTSNAPVKELGLGSGLFDFKRAERYGVHWSLASDIGGGPFLSMFDVMRSFVAQNKKNKVSGATYIRALYRATLAGAELLGLSKNTGNFEIGKRGNFVVLETPKFKKGESAESILKLLVNSNQKSRMGYQDLVAQTYFESKLVFSKI